MVVEKILGVVLIFGGIILMVLFPDIKKYQPKEFTNMSIIVSIFLILLGIFLLKM